MKRRDFLHTTAAGCVLAIAKPSSALNPPAFELEESTIAELQQGLQSGKFSSKSLVEKYTDRINEIDKKGPALRSVIELNPDAESIAAALDRERKERGPRGPLHGIPVLLKDNIDTADMPTTGGSLALVGIVPAQDASLVRMLRRAGAVLLGNLNLHELALGLTTVSSYGGQTLDPCD